MNAKIVKTTAVAVAAVGASSIIALQAFQIRMHKEHGNFQAKALVIAEENFKFALSKLNNTQFKEVINYSINNRYKDYKDTPAPTE